MEARNLFNRANKTTSKPNVYAISLTSPWIRNPSLHKVPEGIMKTTGVCRHWTYVVNVPANSSMILAFMPWCIPDATQYNTIFSTIAGVQQFTGRTAAISCPIIASSNYIAYRPVSACVSVGNTSPALTRNGNGYILNYACRGSRYTVAGDSNEFLSPLNNANVTVAWPSALASYSLLTNQPNAVLFQNNEVALGYWYPLDTDCVNYSGPGQVEGGVSLSSTNEYNANNVIIGYDNSASSNAQTLTFAFCMNYEIESSVTSTSFGNDFLTDVSAPALSTVRKLHRE